MTELPAGASKTRTFDLVTTVDADGCLPTGSVTFTETFAAEVAVEDTPTEQPERNVAFTLQVA